jgi:hypothetical protein
MNKYTKHPLPLNNAWERKTWRRHAPIWFKEFIDGVKNLIDWFPIIWKDRHWDDSYIFEVLKHKLLLQRNHLVDQYRHTDIPRVNRDITICLNLIERIQDDYYVMETYDYHKSEITYTPCVDMPDCSEVDVVVRSENFDAYFTLHKSAVKKCLKQNRSLSGSKKNLARAVAEYKQAQCHKLLFRILSERMTWWWD